ncbi:MAG: hypothetical protein AYP45_07060 [Candidatus Brocadia carolinensis]|uniref:Flagellar assembly protein T C-terminal domain-containing protein n=1 Tax=Candidatus Brocadia carolinensis TaxID=1004156 RepID=A0A1V4AUH8_9BACT|nr:MAG: hypothetical protein AYP45_07060 [Candidatus Brocadia caroliniensis]
MKRNALYKKIRCHALVVLFVSPFISFVTTLSDTVKDTIPPVIYTDLKSVMVTDTNLFFSGEAFDDGGVAQLFVNQHPLEIRAGKHVFFNHLLTLNEGENTVLVKAVDRGGNEMQLSPVKITKKTFDLPETDSRYTVALLPIKTVAGQSIPTEAIYSLFIKAFDEKPKRFHFVERDLARLEEILREQKISNTSIVSPDTAIKLGKIVAADGIFVGTADEDANGISITLRLIDTETARIRASARVYDEDKSITNLEWLIYGLSLKIKRQFPMVQGNVTRVSDGGFYVDAGSAKGIEVGMKLLLFREIREGNFVVKEPLDAVARVVRVQPRTAFVEICGECPTQVKKKDLAITK